MTIFRPIMGLAATVALWLGMIPALVPSAGFAEIGVARAAEMTSETRDLPAFNRIEVQGSFGLVIAAGEKQNVRITTGERALRRVKTEVINETLFLTYRERWFSFLFDEEKFVTISLPLLLGIKLDGAGETQVSGIDSKFFGLEANGAADITLDGTCGRFDFALNGAGELSARDLKCAAVAATINGAGSAQLYASEKVSAVINGVGEITVYGNPEKVIKQVNGFGDINIVD